VSAEEMADEDFDFSKRDERIHNLRAAAMKKIWTERGFEGVMALLSGSGAPHTVGRYVPLCVTGSKASADFLRRCLSIGGAVERKADGCIGGFLLSGDAKARGAILSAVAKGAGADQIVRLVQCAPFEHHTWRLLDQYGEEIRDRYWREVFPSWDQHSDAAVIELIHRLLEAKRPRAAFHAVHMDWPQIETHG
jgi:hypothetical protein